MDETYLIRRVPGNKFRQKGNLPLEVLARASLILLDSAMQLRCSLENSTSDLLSTHDADIEDMIT